MSEELNLIRSKIDKGLKYIGDRQKHPNMNYEKMREYYLGRNYPEGRNLPKLLAAKLTVFDTNFCGRMTFYPAADGKLTIIYAIFYGDNNSVMNREHFPENKDEIRLCNNFNTNEDLNLLEEHGFEVFRFNYLPAENLTVMLKANPEEGVWNAVNIASGDWQMPGTNAWQLWQSVVNDPAALEA